MDDLKFNQLIDRIKQLLREGDLVTAKKAARFCSTRFPDRIEGWLILAGISTPEESLFYLEKARLIEPDDPRVIKAVDWVEQKLSSSTGEVPSIRFDTKKTSYIGSTLPIASPVTIARRGVVWRWALFFILICTLGFFGLGLMPNLIANERIPRGIHAFNDQIKPPQPQSGGQDLVDGNLQDQTQTIEPAEPAPEPEIPVVSAPNLYGCNMEITFVSGPMLGEGTDFHMLDETYFYDKGDKFEEGKNSGIYYIDQAYVILHSGFNRGNRNLPLEIEFFRSYLEHWGEEDTRYIENQIQALIGSEMVWRCQDGEVYRLRVRDIIRLSHEASDRLWLEPENILQIIEDRGGSEDEWIGSLPSVNENSLLLGFCGWGPPEVQVNRSTYYRYVIDFEVLD